MCAPDPNAGIRYQAKQEHKKKLQQYNSASLKYWNREVSAKQRSNTLTKGLSRARSDAYTKALWALGKGRQANEKLYRTKAKLSKYDQKTGTSRASRYMSGKYREILDQQSRIESTINNTFGRNMDITQQGITRQHQNYVAKNRQKLGVRPEFGAPVMMPPSDRLSGALSIASTVVGLASNLHGMGLFSKSAASGFSSFSNMSGIMDSAFQVTPTNIFNPSLVGGSSIPFGTT